MERGFVRTSVAASCVWLTLALSARAQTPADSTAQPQDSRSSPTVEEAGGRLVVSGETVVVTGTTEEPRTSSVATKIDAPLIETPRSVSIVNRRMLDELAVINVTEAHDYAVGFMPLDERGPGSSRGFPVDFYDLRRDGLRTYSWSVREPVALDRIQYLRGSASILYGDGSPGGLVNLVLKKPLPIQRYEIGLSGGELGFGRLTGDATGPLRSDRTMRYRIVGSAEWLDNGFSNDERRTTVMPTFAFDVNPRTTLTFDTEFYDQRGRNYRHAVPATSDTQQGDFSKLPWDLSMAGPEDGWTGGNVAPGLRLDAGIGRGASLHVATRYTRIDGDIDVQALIGLAPDGRTANRYHYKEISVFDEYQSDSFVTIAARTGSIEHQFVTGVEGGLSKTDSQIGLGGAAPLDIYSPEYGPTPDDPPLAPTRFDVTRVGLYATDRVRLAPQVIVEPAVRWSRINIDDHIRATESTNSDVAPSVGVVFLPRPILSFYATLSQGFEAPTPGQLLENGQPLSPVENDSIEAGAKGDVLNGRLSVSAAVYQIHRTNVPEVDARGFYRQIAKAQSHGIELESTGSLTTHVGVYGGYAWCAADITEDSSGFAGRTLPNAPRHKANVFLSYSFRDGLLSAVVLSGGLVHVSDRFTASDNVTIASGYTRADATASYAFQDSRFTLRLVVQNVTDVRYVTSGAGRVLFAGPPRRIALQLTSSF